MPPFAKEESVASGGERPLPSDQARNGRKAAIFCQRSTSSILVLRENFWLSFPNTAVVGPVSAVSLPTGSWKDGPDAQIFYSKYGVTIYSFVTVSPYPVDADMHTSKYYTLSF